MPLVTSKKMFKDAYDNGYAIGAFNVNNMEIIQGIVEAATDVVNDAIKEAMTNIAMQVAALNPEQFFPRSVQTLR